MEIAGLGLIHDLRVSLRKLASISKFQGDGGVSTVMGIGGVGLNRLEARSLVLSGLWNRLSFHWRARAADFCASGYRWLGRGSRLFWISRACGRAIQDAC